MKPRDVGGRMLRITTLAADAESAARDVLKAMGTRRTMYTAIEVHMVRREENDDGVVKLLRGNIVTFAIDKDGKLRPWKAGEVPFRGV